MREMTKQRISTYTMKMRLYPSKEQMKAIDDIFHALHVAFNITFHQVFLKNPQICTEPNENGAVWPDFKKIASGPWRQYLCKENKAVESAHSDSLITNNGLFSTDAKRAWEKVMGDAPINPDKRKDFHFYSSKKPRRSFFVPVMPQKLTPSQDNKKVAWIEIPKIKGKIKVRGFNHKLLFGENGLAYTEALQAGELPKKLSVRVSKDTCGDYFVSITFFEGKKKDRILYLETPVAEHSEQVGIDVGVKDIAILSTGQKIENKHFKKKKQHALSKLNKELSRRWGPANIAFRDYNRSIRGNNRTDPPEQQEPLAQPSKRYLRSQRKKALIERKIARRRDTYYHQQTADITRQSSMIAIESLLVSNLMKNHKLAYALSDAAMSDFLSKLRYKAERSHILLCPIGTFEPSSQLCSVCKALNPNLKNNLSIRAWTCPECGAKHDRDINAARNILRIAIETGGVEDKPIKDTSDKKSTERKPRKKPVGILPDKPEIVVVFSKELTKPNNPRYVIKNTKTNTIIDDAQGVGYRSASNARNCYKAKIRWSKTKC